MAETIYKGVIERTTRGTDRMGTAKPDGRRVLPFRGVANFRDLGGYPTWDGRETRWGVMYRSGHLGRMTEGDLKRFERLGIHTLVDFRSVYERERNPSRLPQSHGMRVLELPILDEANATMRREIERRIKERDFEGYDASVLMRRAYRQFADEFTGAFRQFMEALLEAGGRPVLWHCEAGKDRTGFAAMILLRLLGVDEALAIQDYLLSARYVDRRHASLLMLRLRYGRRAVALVRPLVGVQASWIEAANQAIDEKWGSFDGYVRDGLLLSKSEVTHLQKAYLV